MDLTFVIPDVNAFQSGGNIYNKNLVLGLREINLHPSVMDLKAFQQRDAANLKGYYFFDTLYFKDLSKIFPQKNEDCHFFLIVHHLESLYPPKGWDSATYFLENELAYLQKFDGFVVNSGFTALYLINKGLLQKKVFLPPAIDFELPQNKIKEIPPIKALIVANLVERKGILPFLQLVEDSPIVHKKNVTIQLVGSAILEKSYAEDCLEFIENHSDLKKIVSYHGEIGQEQVRKLYQEATFFISTSYMETFGMALQEAAWFGLPILALDGGNASAHFKHGYNGMLAADMEELTIELNRWVNELGRITHFYDNIQRQVPKKNYTWKIAAKTLVDRISNSKSS